MMDLPDLVVIRHGETEWNRDGRWQGHFDSPLTQRGRDQARAIAQALATAGIGPGTHRFHCSPQGRARATAALILAPGAEPVFDDRLREIGLGDWAGLTRAAVVAQAALPPDAPFLDLYRAAPGGEGFEALHARAHAFLAALTGPAVIVTHGITSRMLRSAALGRGPEGMGTVPGGQGVIHRVTEGRHRTLATALADRGAA